MPVATVTHSWKPDNFQPGDWICGQCGNHNFARTDPCRRCGAPKPVGAGSGGGMAGGGMIGGGMPGGGMMNMTHVKPSNWMPGDWMCDSCGSHNFARNSFCRKCGAAKPQGAVEGAGAGSGMVGGLLTAGGHARGRSRSPHRMG